MDAWDLANDRDYEEALEFYFGLPDNGEDSEVEADDYASTELAELEKSTVSNSVHLSEDERMANSTEVNSVTYQDKGISVDNECVQECHTLSVGEEKDGEWNEDTSYFDNLQTDFSKTPCTHFSSSSTYKEIFYFSKIFYRRYHTRYSSRNKILQFSSCIKNMGCLLAFDNFFTTKRLMTTLLKDNILSVGTVRVNIKGLPSMRKSKDKLCRGEFMFEIQNKVCAIKWMDNRPVTVLTTAFSPKETSVVKRKNKDGSVTYLYSPTAIAQYNKIMCGVDRFDQLLQRYAICLRSVKWCHRIFYYLVDLAIVNSYILKTQQTEKRGPADFSTLPSKTVNMKVTHQGSSVEDQPIYLQKR